MEREMDSNIIKCEVEHYSTLLRIKREEGENVSQSLIDAIVTSRALLEAFGINVDGITIE